MPKELSQSLKPKYRIGECLRKFDLRMQAQKRKEIREELKMSNPTTLSEWENIQQGDKRIIPFDDAMVICRIIGCDPEKLLNA